MTTSSMEIRARNEAWLNLIAQDQIKTAASATDNYTRMYMLEESLLDKVLPSEHVTNEDLDRQADTDKPVIVVDREPSPHPAIQVPFNTMPENQYMWGSRYRVMFHRNMSTRMVKDVDELRTYDMDIRQITSDQGAKMIAKARDSAFFTLIDTVVGTALYATVSAPDSGGGATSGDPTNMASGKSRSYILIDSNGITRETLVELTKPLIATDSAIATNTIVCNVNTAADIMKFGREEMGGDLAQECLRNGWAERNFLGVRFITTIKKDIVPNNTFYIFAEPKFLGRHYLLEDITMYLKKEGPQLEFYSYMTSGCSIGNLNGVAKVRIARS